jgi:predicted HTH transcriptional regulator
VVANALIHQNLTMTGASGMIAVYSNRIEISNPVVIIYGPKKFDDMDRDDRVRACYQHCALKWVMSERTTNHSLRDRFRLPESKSAVVSQAILGVILLFKSNGAGLTCTVDKSIIFNNLLI